MSVQPPPMHLTTIGMPDQTTWNELSEMWSRLGSYLVGGFDEALAQVAKVNVPQCEGLALMAVAT